MSRLGVPVDISAILLGEAAKRIWAQGYDPNLILRFWRPMHRDLCRVFGFDVWAGEINHQGQGLEGRPWWLSLKNPL